MQSNRKPAARSHAAREDNVGNGFILWIGAFGLLVLSLFVFNGT